MSEIISTDRGTYDLSKRLDVYRYFCREFGLNSRDMSLCERFFLTEYENLIQENTRWRNALERIIKASLMHEEPVSRTIARTALESKE